MCDIGETAEFTLQPVETGSIAPVQRLERHHLPPLAIVHLIHDAHAAGADLPTYGVALRSREGPRRSLDEPFEDFGGDPRTGNEPRRILVQAGGADGGPQERFGSSSYLRVRSALRAHVRRPVSLRLRERVRDDVLYAPPLGASHDSRRAARTSRRARMPACIAR